MPLQTDKKTTLTAHLELLRAVLAQARKEGFERRETLQLAQWLCYRVLELDFRCAEAYLALAYLFCLHQDWQRACQLLLHADRQQPGHPRVQAMLTQLRFGHEGPTAAALTAEPASLTPLHLLLGSLELPAPEQLEQRFAALRPVFASLAQRVKES